MTLNACCSNPKCTTFRDLVDFVKLWGFTVPKVEPGQRPTYDLTVPDYWNARRRKAFTSALRQLQTSH